ncbi:MAG: peptide-N-glycosidase F-related protein [Bacteroidota bacterium]
MKRHIYLLFAVIFLGLQVQAASGDTTWVQANNRWLSHDAASTNWYGNYDTMVVFPNTATTYRKILMEFTLGEYPCPASAQYCSQWDYTVQNYLMTRTGDTLELARLITPYAKPNVGDPRFATGFTYNYIFDVTDYYPLLRDTATMRVFYSGYSGGFTVNLRFAFIEGTPERDVKGISKLWTGSHTYGSTTDPINNHYTAMSETAPIGTQSATMKWIITGHGSDNNGCCEFMSHNYQVQLNSTQIAQDTIWRHDCGSNELYPQTGTWIYERANWCPGSLVVPHFHNLPGITAGSNFNLGVTYDAYTGSGSLGIYTTEGSVFYYGGFNKTLDASLDDIIAPTNYEGHYRENPICSQPTIHIKNTGGSVINSVLIQYGIKDSSQQTYTWNGSLASLRDTDVVLPSLANLNSIAGGTGTYTFIAKLLQVNGVVDADTTNNTLTSQFVPTPNWPNNLVILMHTNNEGITAVNTDTASETSWQVFDMNNNVVASRTHAHITYTYSDTLALNSGCYKLVITDLGCDGLDWWVWHTNPPPTPVINSGYLQVKQLPSGALLPMHGYNYSGSYKNDFGCTYTQYFSVLTGLGVKEVNNAFELLLNAYPNPAQNEVTISIQGVNDLKGMIRIYDVVGKVVMEQRCKSNNENVHVDGLSNGIYNVIYFSDAHPNAKLNTRLVIAR